MAYTKTNWVNGTTPLNDKNMNKIENELENLDTNMNTKANTSDVYNKTEIDTKLDTKANTTDISKIKEEITALQTENSRLKGITNALPKVSGEDTSLTLTNTANAPLSDIILKGNTSQQKYSGKNLVPITAQSVEKNGVTFTINNNQLTINGTATNYILFFLNNMDWSYSANNPILEAGTYNLSFNNEIKFKDGGIAITIYNENSKIIYEKSGIKNNFSFSISEKGSCTIRIEIVKGQVFDNNDLQFQIEQGSTATSYEPYVGGTASPNPDYPQDIKVVTGNNKITISNSDNTEKQELPISLGSLELCKIGNYQDYIYKQDDKWYKHKMIKKTILNGTEKWIYADNLKVFFTNDYEGEFASLSCFSNFFINKSFDGNNGAITIGNSYHSAYRTLHLTNWNITTLSDWKNWLSNNKPIVYFTCYTPTEEEITDTTLISQLNELEKAVSYDDTTNISQTNANLPFIINAEAFKKIS